MGSAKKTAKGRLDKYYHLAKDQGYRARSAFKLIHLNKKYSFLESAKAVVDLCAAPGGWLQVASKFMPKSHLLIGVDLVPIKPIPGCITIVGDITTEKCRADIRKELKDWKVDVVLHDGAPNVGRAWLQDAYSQAELVLASFKLAAGLLVPGGTFVTKIFRSKEYNALLWVFTQLFETVEATKPASSRSVSAEIFVVCREFKAFSKIDPRFFDPKVVFEEADLSSTLQASFKAGLLGKNSRTRFREGYEDGTTLLFKEKLLSGFLSSLDPVGYLADTNKIVVDKSAANVTATLLHPKTDVNILEYFKDIKLLGKKELKDILRWRRAVLKEAKKEKESKIAAQEDVDSQDEKINNGEIEKEALKMVKLEKKKALETKAKLRMRMQLQMDNTADIETSLDFGMHDLNTGHSSESHEDASVTENGSADSDIAEDMERAVNIQYQQFIENNKKKAAKKELIQEKLREDDDAIHGKLDSDASDNVMDDGAAHLVPENKVEVLTTESSLWYSNPIFEKLKNVKKEAPPKKSKREADLESKIEFVPQQTIEEFDQSAKDLFLDAENVERALRYTENRKRAKSGLIDDSFNRYTFADDDAAPAWFKDDEKKHNKPIKPLSKEAVAIIREKLRQLDSRPIKKVLEAKGRIKHRAMKKLEALKKKSESIFNSEEFSEKSKSEKIQSLLKKAKKPQDKKKIVVAKGRLRGTKGRPGGIKGRYKMVDKRMIKDERNKKAHSKNTGNKKAQSKNTGNKKAHSKNERNKKAQSKNTRKPKFR